MDQGRGRLSAPDGLGQSGSASKDRLGQSGSTAENERELKFKFETLMFGIQKDRRYHEKLYAFYSHWRDRMKVVTALAGSGAFLIVVRGIKPWDEVLSAFIALWATLDIIIAPDKKADKARELEERYTDLACQVEEAAKNDKNLRHFANLRMQIAKTEMPVKRLIDLEARNDECRARNYSPDEQVPLSKWQKTFGYYFTFGIARLEKWKADRQRGLAKGAS